MTSLKDRLIWRFKWKFNRPKVLNHWGFWLHSETPTTGVFSGNEIQYWPYDTIDPELAEHMETCEHCINDNACPMLDYWEPRYELMGDWIFDKKTNQYEPDKSGEYSAIYNRDHNTVQVLHSTYFQLGNPCSPCYPGQVEFSKSGKFIAFSLPYDMLYPDDIPFNRLTARWIIRDKIDYYRHRMRYAYLDIKHWLIRLRMRLNHYGKDFKDE